MLVAFLGGLEKAPTFLVPIINPPFADNSPHLSSEVSEARKPISSKRRDFFSES